MRGTKAESQLKGSLKKRGDKELPVRKGRRFSATSISLKSLSDICPFLLLPIVVMSVAVAHWKQDCPH